MPGRLRRARPHRLLEESDVARRLLDREGRQVDLDRRRPHPQVARVERHSEEPVEPPLHGDLAVPARQLGLDQLVGPAIAVDRPLEQPLGLLLRRRRAQLLDLVLRDDRRRRQHRLAGELDEPHQPLEAGPHGLRLERHHDPDGGEADEREASCA